VIPATAELSPALSGDARRITEALGPPTAEPGKFSFHYVAWPADQSLLTDQAVIDTGIYTFKVKDAVVGVFDLARWAHDEFSWSFSTNAQRDVLAALRIGQTFDVQFAEPLEEAFHVLRYHFPSGVPNSGYGEYAVHLGVDPARPDGLRIVSSFEPQSKRTESRLPFFFGFRVFGTASGSEPPPVWRELLAAAVRQAAHQRWAHCLLYTAFSLESFIDRQLADRLQAANLGEDYIDHVLQVGERAAELSALNYAKGRVSESAVKKLAHRLNTNVFTPRNRVAHGRLADRDIGAAQAVTALKTAVEFMWDWDDTSRSLLLAPMRGSSFEAMIDDALLDACTNVGG
jgi:hypothetical protein